MPSSCAVPNCNISKTKGEKIRTFSIPKDENIKEKWKQLIGVNVLRSNQRICEKHFDNKYIIKEYIKYDQNGKIISQVPFKRARLEIGAMPTIFQEKTLKYISLQKNWYRLQQNIFLDHSYSLQSRINNNDVYNLSIDSISLSNHFNSATHTIMQDANIQGISNNDSPKTLIKKNARNNSCNINKTNSLNYTDLLSSQVKVEKSEETERLNKNDLHGQLDISSKEAILPEFQRKCENQTKHSITSSEPSNFLTRKCIDFHDSKMLDILCNPGVDLLSKNQLCQTNINTLDKSSNVRKILINSFCLLSNAITFNFEVPCKGFADNFIEIDVPKPWGLSKALIGQEEVLLFTYIVEDENINQRKRHIFEKTVIIKSSRTILYEVYSTNINDTINTILPETLENLHALPEILKKFKDFFICKGIAETLPLMLHTTVSQTCIGTDLRHKKCTLLSFKSKKCKACKLFCTTINKKITRKSQKTMPQVPTSTNSIDQMKLKAMHKRTKLRAKQFKRLKQRISLLSKSIKTQEEKVTPLSDEQLKKISKKQRLLIQEILLLKMGQ